MIISQLKILTYNKVLSKELACTLEWFVNPPTDMELKFHKAANEISIAELTDKNFIISTAQDILDIFGNLIATDCEHIIIYEGNLIIYEGNLHADFFDLKTRLAGEVLQKFSNYRVKLAIVGDFAKYDSKNLHDFIFDSNNQLNLIKNEKDNSTYFSNCGIL